MKKENTKEDYILCVQGGKNYSHIQLLLPQIMDEISTLKKIILLLEYSRCVCVGMFTILL